VDPLSFEFIDKHEAAQLLKVHPGTLNRYRQEGRLIEGIHYTRLSSQTVRYNKALLQDWAANREDPAAHRRAMEIYIASLLGNQPRRKGAAHPPR
jgi:hypothetical protein